MSEVVYSPALLLAGAHALTQDPSAKPSLSGGYVRWTLSADSDRLQVSYSYACNLGATIAVMTDGEEYQQIIAFNEKNRAADPFETIFVDAFAGRALITTIEHIYTQSHARRVPRTVQGRWRRLFNTAFVATKRELESPLTALG